MDYKLEIENTIVWIRETVAKTGLSKVIVAVSGGVDSAVAVSLAVKALGVEHVYAALFPYGDLHSQGIDDAKDLVRSLGIPQDHVVITDIKSSVDQILKQVQDDSNLDSGQARMTDQLHQIRVGNVMARVRMIYLFDLAKKLQALVLGTENKTEYFLGYFTRFGDEASDIEPIRKYYKTQVWELAKELGVPDQIISKAPTAGLWEGQTDENELGFSYKDADTVLAYHFDQGLSKTQIVEKGVQKEIVEKVLERVAKNDFKHKLPYVHR